MNYHKKTLLLIAIATVTRCIIASSIELGNDEVYYRMYAQFLQWNYFDHPPMVGWLIRLTTFNLLADSEFFIRLGAIAASAFTTWLLFLSGKKLKDNYTGFLTACIYTASIYGSIIAGTFILPDSPQMVCWTAGMYFLIGFVYNSENSVLAKRQLLLFGVAAGIGMLCKIHTSFLWLGLLLYILFYNRQWFKEPALYASGIITLLFFFPVIQWNIHNHFVTYLYHSQRVDVSRGGFDMDSFLTFIAGQFFYCNPVIFILIVIAIIAAFKNKLTVAVSQQRLLLLCSLPLIVTAMWISFFRNVLPHWTGPAYSGLILLTACYFSRRDEIDNSRKKLMPRPLLAANILLLLIITAGILFIRFFPGTLGKKDPLLLGDGDATLDMIGWKEFGKNFQQQVQVDIQSGTMKKDAVIITDKWFPAAHIDEYVAMPMQKDLIAIGDTNDIHQYAWINSERKQLKAGDDAYCIVPSNEYRDITAIYGDSFTRILPALVIEQQRNGKVCRRFYIYRLRDFKRWH